MQPLQSVESVQRAEPDGPCETSPFMTPEQAGAILNVSPEHIRRGITSGRIPGFKFGRAYRVFGAFVQAVLAEMEAGGFVDFDEFIATRITQVSEVAS